MRQAGIQTRITVKTLFATTCLFVSFSLTPLHAENVKRISSAEGKTLSIKSNTCWNVLERIFSKVFSPQKTQIIPLNDLNAMKRLIGKTVYIQHLYDKPERISAVVVSKTQLRRSWDPVVVTNSFVRSRAHDLDWRQTYKDAGTGKIFEGYLHRDSVNVEGVLVKVEEGEIPGLIEYSIRRSNDGTNFKFLIWASEDGVEESVLAVTPIPTF